MRYLQSTLKDPDSIKQFSIVSGPLSTYWRPSAFSSEYSAAWLICFEYNAKNSYGGYVGVKRDGLMLKRSGDVVYHLDGVNWASVPDRC